MLQILEIKITYFSNLQVKGEVKQHTTQNSIKIYHEKDTFAIDAINLVI
jgi:hypothetical protein